MNNTTFEPASIDDKKLYISPRDDAKLVFEESLDLVDEEGRGLHVVTVAVEAGVEQDSLMVYQYSSDRSVIMRVQSLVLRSLDTGWEVRHISRGGSRITLRICGKRNKYMVFRCVQGEQACRMKSTLRRTPKVRMILEGANIVLLRKLALSRLFGRVRCQTVSHEGEVRECEYVVERGASMEVRVRRRLGSGEELTTTLSHTGRILQHQWSATGYGLRSRDSARATTSPRHVQEDREDLAEPEPPADVDAYFAKKAELIRLTNRYLADHSDVKDMIADFLKELLLEKPDDVVEFADEYFAKFLGITREPAVHEASILRPVESLQDSIDKAEE